jgi:hypothetical protein
MHLLTRPDFSTTPSKKPSLTQCTFVFTNLGAKYKVFCSWQKHREWEWRMTFFECFTVLATWALASTYLVLCPCKPHRAGKNRSPRLRKHMREQNKASHADERKSLRLLSAFMAFIEITKGTRERTCAGSLLLFSAFCADSFAWDVLQPELLKTDGGGWLVFVMP